MSVSELAVFAASLVVAGIAIVGALTGGERLLRHHDWRYVVLTFVGFYIAAILGITTAAIVSAPAWMAAGSASVLLLIVVGFCARGARAVARDRAERAAEPDPGLT